MSDVYDELRIPSALDPQSATEISDAIAEPTVDTDSAEKPPLETPEPGEEKIEPPEDPALARFAACRWHEKQDAGASYCSHRDVLPFAGKNGFNASAWCPDCTFYKVKRTVKRRRVNTYDDY